MTRNAIMINMNFTHVYIYKYEWIFITWEKCESYEMGTKTRSNPNNIFYWLYPVRILHSPGAKPTCFGTLRETPRLIHQSIHCTSALVEQQLSPTMLKTVIPFPFSVFLEILQKTRLHLNIRLFVYLFILFITALH